MEKDIQLFLMNLKKMPHFNRVKFVFLFGSVANGNSNKLSDVDFAIYYEGDSKERFKFRLEFLRNLPERFDVQVFQDLPLYVKKEVLKGKLIYAVDERFVYDIAYEIIKEYADFKKGYYDYIKMEEIQ